MVAPHFFVLGNPRSGTSLFRLMLNSHPHVVVPPECGFLQWWYSKYSTWSQSDSVNPYRIAEYVEDLISSKKIETWNLSKSVLINQIGKLKPENYTQLSSIVYSLYSPHKNGLVGDKNNYYINHTQLIGNLYPDAKIIHLVRDGRDVACSYLALHSLDSKSVYAPKVSREIDEIATEWSSNTSKLNDFLKDKLGLVIKYEDLILNTEETLKRVCDFLEIQYSTNMLRYYEKEFHDEPASTMDWRNFNANSNSNF